VVDFETILYEKSDGIATITLNRPDRMNAFNHVMINEWSAALEDARVDRDVKAIILTGAGRGFCSGADLREGSTVADVANADSGPPSAADQRSSLRDGVHAVPRQAMLLDKPYIGAINGAAIGAGMDMASQCDIRIASESARFGMTFVLAGIVPADGGCWYLPRIIGLQKTLELIWTGQIFDAQEALRIGYVSKVVPADDLMTEARALATKIASGPAVAIQLMKRLVYRGLDTTLYEALEQAQHALAITQSTTDAIEGPRAISEKRAPEFTSR
jgi:2-(1,2-epoxy-1,2-dihydrophenyl)acetyl-CoA isomerase